MMVLTAVFVMGFGILAFGILLYIESSESGREGDGENGQNRRADGEDDSNESSKRDK